jgi:hypothetical protein
MKVASALLLAGALALPGATAQDATPPRAIEPIFEVTPICGGDGDVVGLQILSNIPVNVAITWDRRVCAARTT